MEKYIKINTKNIYNYLTIDDIIYINKKFEYRQINLINAIKNNIGSWLIKDKNILLINLKDTIDKLLIIIININNLDNIKIHHNYYINSFVCLLNNIRVDYYNKRINIVYFSKNKVCEKTLNGNVIIKNDLHIYYKNFIKHKINVYYRNHFIDYNFYYQKYKIYIKYYTEFKFYINATPEIIYRKTTRRINVILFNIYN